MKKITFEHFSDVWKLLAPKKGFKCKQVCNNKCEGINAFAKHMAKHCDNVNSNNQVKARLKK